MKKWISIIVIVLLMGGGSYWYVNKKHATQAAEVTTIIPTATAKIGTLESKVSGSGSLTPSVDEDVKPDADHTVYDIYVSVGDKVKKGQAILIYNNGTKLYAPDGGTVTAINVYNKARVSAGQAVAHITNYDSLDTVIQVDELDIPSIKKGQTADIVVNAYPDQTYKGKVTDIANVGNAQNGVSTFDVTIHLTSVKNLKAGMTTTADIITEKKGNTLLVPIEAVHKAGNQTYVLVDESTSSKTSNSEATEFASSSTKGSRGSANGNSGFQGSGRGIASNDSNAQRVQVKTGINNDSYIEILSGLKEGQVVQLPAIVHGQSQSSSGNNQNGMMFGGFGGANRDFPRGNRQGNMNDRSSSRGGN